MLKDKILSPVPIPSDIRTDVISCEDPIVAQKIQYYEEWLANDAVRSRIANSAEKIEDYEHIAAIPTFIDGQEIVTFAPFEQKLSAWQTITPKQVHILWAIFAVYILSLVFYSVTGLVAIIAVTTVFYVIDLLICFLVSMNVFRQSTEEQIDDAVIHALAHVDWPRYTILCPLYREAAVVPQFVKAIRALDYPRERLQVLFLTEEDDVTTREAIKALKLPSYFEIIIVPDGQPRTKPRACNYGLLKTRGSYVVIFDAEDKPDPLQLKKAVLAFANSDSSTACVQAKLNFYNAKQNMLTRWFTAEYSSWFDMTLPGLQMLNVPLPLGGTSNHFRADVLRRVGAWDPFNVTEDCDLGLRLGRHGMKTVVLDSTTWEEANSQYKNWMRQRSRWIKGYMQTYLVYMRNPLEYLQKGQIKQFLSLQFFIGGKTAILLINPLMWMLLLIYLFFHALVVGAYHVLYPMPVLYMASLCLIFGNVLYIYTYLIGCMKRRHYDLVKSTLSIPIYWAMASAAAYIALYQLIIKPHYWEKTLHGLHLLKEKAKQTSQELLAVGGAVTKKLKTITLEVVATTSEKTQKLQAISNEDVITGEGTMPTEPLASSTPSALIVVSSSSGEIPLEAAQITGPGSLAGETSKNADEER
jgi:cellulose synthase/poly-beta-1,6-N-acetylglucosamine synthase-like glycosyltransferase